MCVKCIVERSNFYIAQAVVAMYHEGKTVKEIASQSQTLDPLDIAYIIEDYA